MTMIIKLTIKLNDYIYNLYFIRLLILLRELYFRHICRYSYTSVVLFTFVYTLRIANIQEFSNKSNIVYYYIT